MAKGKRFYWIKLKENFMTSDTVDFLMSQPNGANYVVLYQMLCLKTMNTGGTLARQLGEIIVPYEIEKIQRDCKFFNIDTIRIALELYKKLGLIYKQEEGFLQISNYNNIVGSETDYAIQKRLQRKKKMDNSMDNVHTDIRDKILEIEIRDKDKESNKDKDLSVSPKPINPNISEIFNYWNSKNIIKHNELTDKTKNGILKALKIYSLEQIKMYIDRYDIVLKDKNYYFDTKWTLAEFLKQANAISTFADDGSKWINYQSRKSQVKNSKDFTNTNSDGNKGCEVF